MTTKLSAPLAILTLVLLTATTATAIPRYSAQYGQRCALCGERRQRNLKRHDPTGEYVCYPCHERLARLPAWQQSNLRLVATQWRSVSGLSGSRPLNGGSDEFLPSLGSLPDSPSIVEVPGPCVGLGETAEKAIDPVVGTPGPVASSSPQLTIPTARDTGDLYDCGQPSHGYLPPSRDTPRYRPPERGTHAYPATYCVRDQTG